MNFDNLIHYDLLTGLYRFIPFLLILLFWHWPYTLPWLIYCSLIKVRKNLNPFTGNGERENRSQAWKSWILLNEKRDQKVKQIKKGERLNNSGWEADGIG